jgi:hypothetical protein
MKYFDIHFMQVVFVVSKLKNADKELLKAIYETLEEAFDDIQKDPGILRRNPQYLMDELQEGFRKVNERWDFVFNKTSTSNSVASSQLDSMKRSRLDRFGKTQGTMSLKNSAPAVVSAYQSDDKYDSDGDEIELSAAAFELALKKEKLKYDFVIGLDKVDLFRGVIGRERKIGVKYYSKRDKADVIVPYIALKTVEEVCAKCKQGEDKRQFCKPRCITVQCFKCGYYGHTRACCNNEPRADVPKTSSK